MRREMSWARDDALTLGHLPRTSTGSDGFELDAYDPEDPFSKPDSVAARCVLCEEILALDLGEKPYRFGRGWTRRCVISARAA